MLLLLQMGHLFSQMSSLVLAQGETVSRIEDDVEAGLQDTEEAHTDLLYVHEVTKGNRGLIIKIFGLLAFFILLFMVWT
jgi:syntaxin 5